MSKRRYVHIQYIKEISDTLKTVQDENGNPIVGGVLSIADILAKIGSVAFDTDAMPNTRQKVSQYMFLYESVCEDVFACVGTLLCLFVLSVLSLNWH